MNSKKITLVCYANYCRSPVAEKILKNLLPHVNVESKGIKPLIYKPTMDKRSIKYLKELGINDLFHTPRPINKLEIESSNLILALDQFILIELLKSYKTFANKIKIFTLFSNDNVNDPYKFKKYEDYKTEMKKISYNCELWKKEIENNHDIF